MKIAQIELERFRGWRASTPWRPGRHAVLVGPNSGGKTSVLEAVDLVLNPFRNAYRDLPGVHDFFDLKSEEPFLVTVILDELTAEDRDVFEPYLEGQRDDGTFGPAESPGDEFDERDVVLRMSLRATLGEPAIAFFARPDCGERRVGQDHKLRIGWHYVRAGLDPLHELAFYSGSVFSKLFEREDLSEELDAIRKAIDEAKGGLLSHPSFRDAREYLDNAARRLRLVSGADGLDFAVIDLSDRRVLQSLQLVLRGHRSDEHLPLRCHGGGLLRTLLIAAILQQARTAEANLILAIEEPEQNLEPINQRLVTRSLLLAEDTGASQVLLATHAPDIASLVPLESVHLVRESPAGPRICDLRDVEAPEHKFFERHARGPLVDGLYADLVLLVEGPTERGALPELWSKGHPDGGLDERRIELFDTGGIDEMPSFVRFYSALDIPVAVVCDSDRDKEARRRDILEAGAGLMVCWKTHSDWEGVLAAEGDVGSLCRSLDRIRATVGTWEEQAAGFIEVVRREVKDSPHLEGAENLTELVAGYEGDDQRAALAVLMRQGPVSFKSTRDGRLVAKGLPEVPATVLRMMEEVHSFAAGSEEASGQLDL